MAASLLSTGLSPLLTVWAGVACGLQHPKAFLARGSMPHRSWAAEVTGQCFQPVGGLLLPSFMTGAELASLHGRGCSRPRFPEAGARQCLQCGHLQIRPLLMSGSWGLCLPSFLSFSEQQLKAAGSSVPRPSSCSRLAGETAKPCVRLRSQPAKKFVLGLGKMCPSSRPPGAAVEAAVAGDWAGRARAGGACSWMKRKEVFICCC